eukprot:CAMPEP_0194560574 /NCGR_PEP_ID=MMETSP0292-20121207/1694_1 /TAXON_ID=39354 /ORGANISM="Heterosigma akashiwo, Strain CCMP2393" /LENGTH=69 /DNA_ID=CAMNT_0039408769 /DNA_START=491 /DNA_END=700 /DNA_ORIENTATION=-
MQDKEGYDVFIDPHGDIFQWAYLFPNNHFVSHQQQTDIEAQTVQEDTAQFQAKSHAYQDLITNVFEYFQ